MIHLTILHFHCLACDLASDNGTIQLDNYHVAHFRCNGCGNVDVRTQRLTAIITDPNFRVLPVQLIKERFQ
jgi:hypothetical protein